MSNAVNLKQCLHQTYVSPGKWQQLSTAIISNTFILEPIKIILNLVYFNISKLSLAVPYTLTYGELTVSNFVYTGSYTWPMLLYLSVN